ncbi:MAG: S-methyl-5'-thioadenosine phosphorylase [Spirochaetales bacterium]|nr:S-methyl-5'-thioadenosine phosphorylase [Spirochaetales bacterium]
MTATIGVIGGSGIYEIEGASVVETIDIPTPFGMPSDYITIVNIRNTNVAFLPRHGKGHRLLPTEVPSKANIWALKSLGVSQILSISAVGSLGEGYKPGDFVVCDQLVDRTRGREWTFFGEGIVGHIGFAEPFCSGMREKVIGVFEKNRYPFHKTGTLITMEGPLFSTKGESLLYRQWKADLIGMTALPEAKLAREAEICYAVIAMVTDYDCWHEAEEAVTVDMVLATMKKNVTAIKTITGRLIEGLAPRVDCECRHAAQYAIMTEPSRIPFETRRKLALFYGKYWNGE